MKKVLTVMLALALALAAFGASAEGADNFFARLARLEWSFCSGAGAWSTDMRIAADGSFSGEYHDSEMGEDGETYPNGTVYLCSFTGTLSLAEQVNDTAWKLRVDSLKRDESIGDEYIDDGIRYVKAEPYGLSEGDEMILYAPGTSLSDLPEEMIPWTHALDLDEQRDTLGDWFLASEKNESGFVGTAAEPVIGLPNPWVDLTAEQLEAESGLVFGVPEDAENVIYRYLPAEKLAEMQWTWEGCDLCARICPAALEEGQLMNISGMYFSWEHEEPITVGHCPGTIAMAQTGTEDWVELCQWYDAAPGLMYSLSVATTDLDGLDLTAIAEQIYVPVQGNR